MNNFNYNKLTPFKWFVLENFPFIEADFDALTEWQLFCKLGKEINKIINSENTLGTQIENVTNAFIELQNYVNNYFENLDVQDEINNKLNEMTEQGIIQNILTNYTNIIKVYNTHTDLMNDRNLVNNQKVRTLGYYSINDGGGADYIITNDNTSSFYQEQTLTSNLYARIILKNNEINVKQLGAYGDNIHDDTQAIQNCLNNFTIIYFPIGFYYITSGLTLNKDTIINGSSKLSIPNLGSFIRFSKQDDTLITGNNNALHVEINNMGFFSSSASVSIDSNLEDRPTEPYNPYHYNQTLQNCNGILCTKKLKITNCYFTGFSGYAINANANALITDVWISNSNVAIRVNGYDPIITRPYITLCNTGIKMIAGSATSIFLYDIWIDQIVEHGIECASITGIITGLIDHIGYSGIHATGNARLNLNMRIGRCGMYYAGTDKDQLTNEQLELASGLFLTNILNSQIRYTFEYRSIGTSTGTTDYMSPKCALGVKQFINSIFEFIEDDTKYIGCKVINRNNSNGTIITQNGIKKWSPTDNDFVNIYQLNT